jgi:DNA-binding MarR family transcriptional regulator
MSHDGLINVKQDKDNRRKHEVVLTEKGLELVTEATDLLHATHAGVLGSLSFKEQNLMKELVDRLITKASLKEGKNIEK